MPRMCAIGCSNAIGFANLEGKPGTPVEGHRSVLPLCARHYQEALDGTWGNINLLGWEELPLQKEKTSP